MSGVSGRHLSPWVETTPPPDIGATAFRDVRADVIVAGAGITGITTALLLQRAGRSVVVVEAGQVGRSTTTASTVKVTYGHKTLYSTIEEKAGLAVAVVYAEANVAGFGQVLDLAASLGQDCMLHRGVPHVVCAEHADEVRVVEREADVARRIGLPVTLIQQAPLPFDVEAAVAFEDQALFHPGRYLAGLAEAFVREGGTIIEDVRVRDVDEDGDACRVDTTSGQLSAGHVVIATQYPILDRGGQFARVTARRSYGIAGVLPAGVSAGMTINVGSPTHSTRTATLDGEQLLIVVGEGHPVGHTSPTAQRWTRLQNWARERFGVTEFRNHWSAQETSTLDHIPLVGFISPSSRRVLTATGYDGWGMTNGTAAAMLVRDLITGQHNPWAATFDARRAETSPPGTKAVKHNIHVAKTWLKDRAGGAPDGSPQDLRPGEAAVLEVDGQRTAAYRDGQGELHMVSAVCTHMGCDVAWNEGEASWDCPCHGSRFSYDGAVLHGPATTPLPQRSPR